MSKCFPAAATFFLVLAFGVLPCAGAPGAEPGAEPADKPAAVPEATTGSVSFLWGGDSDFETVPGATLGLQEGRIEFPLPIYDTETFRAAAGLDYRWDAMEFTAFPPLAPIPMDLDLHRLEFPFNFLCDPTGDGPWSFWVRLAPGIYSDFRDINSDSFNLAALLIAFYEVNEKFSLAAGASYSREFGEASVYPAVGFIWRPNPTWLFRLTAPRPTITFAPRDSTLLSLAAYPGGGGWSVFDPVLRTNRDLDFESYRVGLTAEQHVTGGVWAFLEGGILMAQAIEIEGVGTDFDLEGSFYVSTGIRLRF